VVKIITLRIKNDIGASLRIYMDENAVHTEYFKIKPEKTGDKHTDAETNAALYQLGLWLEQHGARRT